MAPNNKHDCILLIFVVFFGFYIRTIGTRSACVIGESVGGAGAEESLCLVLKLILLPFVVESIGLRSFCSPISFKPSVFTFFLPEAGVDPLAFRFIESFFDITDGVDFIIGSNTGVSKDAEFNS